MTHQKTALITGITGQDGSYLAELLLDKGYRVIGLLSNAHNPMGHRNIAHFEDRLTLEEGDLVDTPRLMLLIEQYQPDEIYNLAAITFVPEAWQQPSLTFEINTLAVARLVEYILAKQPNLRLYQASSSKMFGKPTSSPQTEVTPLAPADPYAISKAATHTLIGALREKHQRYFVSGILFNHESERRGPEFVTRKITRGAARIKLGLDCELTLGDLSAQQDWGYAPDYVLAMWQMLQQESAADYVIATGELHSVREVCEAAFSRIGLTYTDYVQTDPSLARSTDRYPLVGDPSNAKKQLGWQPQTTFQTMIEQMVDHDLELISKEHA